MLDARKTDAPGKGKSSFALGRQITVDYYSCRHCCLLSSDAIEKAMLSAARDSNATVISSSFHNFEPQGVSGVVIIAESHFTIHAWPEHDYAAVDMFTCGNSVDLDRAVSSLKRSLGASRVVITADIKRGIIQGPEVVEQAGDSRLPAGACAISWKQDQENHSPWGLLAAVDIYGCNAGILENELKMASFFKEISGVLSTPNQGCPPEKTEIGSDEGDAYTMTRVEGNTTMAAHVVPASDAVYLDVFSCEHYEPRILAEAAVRFLAGSHYKMHIALRE